MATKGLIKDKSTMATMLKMVKPLQGENSMLLSVGDAHSCVCPYRAEFKMENDDK
jgi:hypothetical protein